MRSKIITSVVLLAAAIALAMACKKDDPTVISFWGCHTSKYYYTYAGGNTDTTTVTYISDDSLSYTTRSGGTSYIYTYKVYADSVSVRRYTNSLSNLTFWGRSLINNKGFSIADLFYKFDGSINNTGTSTYNSEGRPTHSYSDYVDYQNDHTYYYNTSGNKTYSIFVRTGLGATRDSFVYFYDASHTNNAFYGYPYAKLYGLPDNNLVLQTRRYDASVDTIRSVADYSYILDPDGNVAQKTTVTTYAGSGGVQTTVEKFTISCN